MVVSGPLSTPLLPIDMGTLAPLLSTSFRTSTSSGLGLPPASRTSLSTSRITPTGPVSAKDSANTSNADPWDGSFPDDEGASRPNAGMIAGISIGVIVGLLIILGSYIIVRRRKKARKNIENESDDTLAKRESDKMVVDPDEALYQSGAPHMSYRDHTQELDPSQPRTFSIHAHELRAYATPGELTRHHSVSRSEASPPDSSQDQDIEPTTQDEPVAPSQHVEAQRIRELEWLEMEEARLRQRREQLIRQSGEYSSRPADSQ
jgi:LPXTG-motif cell wall-anchored protein